MADHLHTRTEGSLERKYSPRVAAASATRSARVGDTLELLLGAAYLLWIEFVLKDWLISYYQPYYPYVASLATILGIIAGFIALQFVHNPRVWRDVVLTGCTILTAANIAQLLPKKLGVVPAVAVLTCGLAASSLLIAKGSISMTRRYFYLAAVTIGLIALICQPGNEPEKIFWGFTIAIVTLSVGAAAVFVYRRGDNVGWKKNMSPSFYLKAGSILLVGGILVLFSITMVPLFSLSFTDTSLLGLGLGWGSQTILQTSDLIPPVLKQFHVVPALVLTICSLAILLFLIRKVNISEWRFTLYAAAAIIGLTAFAYYSASALSVGSGSQSLVKSAHIASPETTWFALTVAKEQGLLVIFILACILIISLAIAALVLAAPSKGPEQEARVSLCAGVISSLYGILLGTHIGPPFLTGNSVAGTWALAIAFASLGIASSRSQRRANTRVFVEATVKKQTRRVGWLVGSGVAALAIVIGVVLYQHALSKVIQPFAGTSPPPGYSNYVPLSSISREMQDATIAFEDPDFFDHHGLDLRSVHYSLRVDLDSGRPISGGSTITQQLVKNLFLTKERTLWRKLKEAALALEMERLLPKQRVLELYLNTIDYGMGQHGVDAAANYYFHKQPRQLTLAESAILVGLIPHPPDQSLSRYQLLTGQRTALQRIRNRWPDRYSESDIVSAAQIPLDDLIQPGESIEAHETTEPLSTKEPNNARRYWRRIGIGIGLAVFLGVGIAVALAWRVVTAPNGEQLFKQDPRLSRKNIFLFGVVFFGALSIAAIHWHKVNSERAEYTIIYPYTASPNRDDRPSDVGIDCVVLHATAETTEGSRHWFLDPTSKVSAHFVVSKEGEIFQSVPLEQRAWHAGVSELDGVPDVNNYSVGIEIVNRDDGTDPYTDVQYEAVARIIHQLRSRYTIPDERIVSHAQIAPGRKSDPVGFDFDRLRITLAQFR